MLQKDPQHLILLKNLAATNVLKTPRIVKALEEIDRAGFVTEEQKLKAYEDTALPIGAGQTISQPTVVAFMLELLQPKPEDKILDVGSGSGYTTALLAYITGPKGYVYGIEIMQSLLDFGRQNLHKKQITNAKILPAGKALGFPDEAPYDCILVSAFATEIPVELVKQLKVGGVLVIPIKNDIYKIVRLNEEKIEKTAYTGFSFVPLIDTTKSITDKKVIELDT